MAPAATLARVDGLFDSLGLTYATCVFGVIDTDALALPWSNAGHPRRCWSATLGRPSSTEGVRVMLGVTGGAVSARRAPTWSGDLLVLYTDGLIERRGESLQDGLERLALVARTVLAAAGGSRVRRHRRRHDAFGRHPRRRCRQSWSCACQLAHTVR